MNTTDCFSFFLEQPIQYIKTGKFESPNPDWVHLDRWLANDFELMVVTEGVLYVASGDTQYEVSAGEYILLPPHTHQYGWKGSSCAFYWLHFIAEQAGEDIPPEDPKIVYIPRTAHLPNTDRLVILMKQTQDAIRRYNSAIQKDYLATAILCELNCQCFNPQRSKVDIKKQQIYSDIVDYVHWYLHTDIKVQDIARHFGYNEKYLSHLFSNVAGLPLKQYILQQKMEQAKFLLSDTNDSVQKISEKLGFGDSRNFMKIFKKLVGMTPTDYRNSTFHRIVNH